MAADVAGLAATLLGDGDGDRVGVDVDSDETKRMGWRMDRLLVWLCGTGFSTPREP